MKTYLWNGEQVIQLSRPVTVPTSEDYLDMFCVDAFQEDKCSRYGVYSEDEDGTHRWFYIPYVLFPKEFKAHLLLML